MLSNLLESLRVLRTPCVKCRSKIIRNFSDSARKAFPELAMFSSEQEKVFVFSTGTEFETGYLYNRPTKAQIHSIIHCVLSILSFHMLTQ